MKIVIIGGVAAGAKVAAKTKRMLPDSEIHIYTMDTHVSYSACGLPYYIEGNFEDYKKLLIRSVEEFENSGIHIHLENEVTKILSQDKKIIVNDKNINEYMFINYDILVIATGASPRIPDIKNISLKNVFTLKTLNDGINIKNTMQNCQNICLIGGGYINIELLEAFLKNEKNVTLIEKSNFIMPGIDEDISSLLQNYIKDKFQSTCKIINNDEVSEFLPGDSAIRGILTKNGIGFETDMAVIGIGVTPNTDIAKEAGIETGATGGIKVNSRMQTNIPDIYACGDCVEKINMISNTPCYFASGATANKEGRVVANNISGKTEEFEGILGSLVTRFCSMNISKTGLTEKSATSLNYDVITAIVTKKDMAGYMPDVQNLTLKLIADRRSHKLLGAQAIGSQNADKKINIISAGLQNDMTVEDLLDLDLSYAPPFSTSIDILHTTARILKGKLG